MDAKIHRTIWQLHTFIQGMIYGGGSMLFLVLMLTLGPILETKYFPVTTDVHASLVKVEGDKMIFWAVGNKVRDCSMLEAHILVDPDGSKGPKPPRKGVLWVIEDGEGPRTRALGYQDLGKWAVIPVGKKLTVEATYSCKGIPWETRSVIGTWEQE